MATRPSAEPKLGKEAHPEFPISSDSHGGAKGTPPARVARAPDPSAWDRAGSSRRALRILDAPRRASAARCRSRPVRAGFEPGGPCICVEPRPAESAPAEGIHKLPCLQTRTLGRPVSVAVFRQRHSGGASGPGTEPCRIVNSGLRKIAGSRVANRRPTDGEGRPARGCWGESGRFFWPASSTRGLLAVRGVPAASRGRALGQDGKADGAVRRRQGREEGGSGAGSSDPTSRRTARQIPSASISCATPVLV